MKMEKRVRERTNARTQAPIHAHLVRYSLQNVRLLFADIDIPVLRYRKRDYDQRPQLSAAQLSAISHRTTPKRRSVGQTDSRS